VQAPLVTRIHSGIALGRPQGLRALDVPTQSDGSLAADFIVRTGQIIPVDDAAT
jgi:hypothetical protein